MPSLLATKRVVISIAGVLVIAGVPAACSGVDVDLDETTPHPAVDPNDDDGRAASGDATPPPAPPPVDAGACKECPVPAPSWDCDRSDYEGKQWWTCNGSSIYRCETGAPFAIACADGCVLGPAGTDDTCNPPPSSTPAKTPPIPPVKITIGGDLFTESAVRKPLEDGLRYAIERIAKNVDVGNKTVPSFTVNFIPSKNSYASGIADVTYTNVYVPYGYPITGPNQNYVVNITIHEIGHILAHHLIAPRHLRDTCVNEGLASWIAGKYWMNAASKPVASLRDAARYDIARGAAYASMSTCNSASDPWYKVYASFFEYLELNAPGAISSVSSAKTSKSAYAGAWSTWLK